MALASHHFEHAGSDAGCFLLFLTQLWGWVTELVDHLLMHATSGAGI